jgi:GNAT superfamily N-acetyltransferase
METMTRARRVGPEEAATVAALLDDFQLEFGSPSPGRDELADRLRRLLAGDATVALVVGEPALGFALMTLRPSVWYAGPVGYLDELYVVPEHRSQGLGGILLQAAEDVVRERGGELLEINVDAADHDTRRFYERHGYTNIDQGQTEPSFYYYREFPSSHS